MNGRWEKVSGDSTAPSEISVRVRDGDFTVHMRSGDFLQLKLDGAEHVYKRGVTYIANGNSSRIQVIRKDRMEWAPEAVRKQLPSLVLDQQYFLRDNDRTLVLVESGKETIYKRPSVWRTLTTGTP